MMAPNEAPSLVWQIAERFGFPAALVVLLLLFIWVCGRGITAELGRLTRAVCLVVLAMQWVPQLHEMATDIYDESLDAAKKRKEDLSHERQRKKP